MRNFLKAVLLVFVLYPLVNFAADETFVEGKDYQMISINPALVVSEPGKVVVLEFFNYGCPACFLVEPIVQKWLAGKPKDVIFKRVPVVFHSSWEAYAKAYYIADALGVENKITPKIFSAIQQQHQRLDSVADLAKFFNETAGVKVQDFESAYNGSPAIAIKMQQGSEMGKAYSIRDIPTFIVGGQYKTNAAMLKGKDRLPKALDYLIQKARNVKK